MFSKIRGRRTTALATTLAVVVGLAITPAFTATAAEGDPVEGSAAVAVVEPAAPVVEAVEPEAAPAPESPAAPVDEPTAVQAPVEASAPTDDPEVQSPIAPLGARLSGPAAEPASDAVAPQAVTSTIGPSTIGPLVAGASVNVQFTLPWGPGELWKADGLPFGLSLDEGAGFLTGQVNAPGTYSFVIRAQTCAFFCWTLSSKTYTVTVSGAPVVTTNNLPGATVGLGYSQQLMATPAGVMSYRVSQGTLPAGLTLSPTGLISGIPTFAAGYTASTKVDFSVIANNGIDSAAKRLSITVTTPKPLLGNTALATAIVGVPYSQALPIITGHGTLTYDLLSGRLPLGLTLGTNGVISGTPQYVATDPLTQEFKFNARVTGPTGSDNQQFKLTLNLAGPTITTTVLSEAWLTKTYSQAITTTGYGVTITAAGLPAGLALVNTPSTGYSITGVAEASGPFTVVLTARNAAGTVAAPLALTVNAAPVITTGALPIATVGTEYSFPVAAIGKDVTFTAVSNARGVLISPSGELTWTPSSQRNVSVEVTATNPSGSHTKTFQLESYAVPTIITTDLGFGVVGETFASTVNSTGRSTEVTVTGGMLPTGLKMFKTGKFGGYPTVPGTYSFEVTVTNPVGRDTQRFEVTVYDLPTISTTKLDRATVGDSYLDAVQFTGLGASAAVLGGVLPTGLTLNADGTITGTPTEEGFFEFQVQVTNLAGSVVKTVELDSYARPTIAATPFGFGKVGKAFAQSVAFTGLSAEATVTAGTLPTGLAMLEDGTFRGKPTTPGIFSFTVTVTNPAGFASQLFEVKVYDRPAISTLKLDLAKVGGSYSDTVVFSGLDAGAVLLDGALPTGLTLDADGTITGIPTVEGVFNFRVKVTNPAGSASRDFSIRSFQVPEITTSSLDSAVTGVSFRDRIRAIGDNAVFTVAMGSLPDGLKLTKQGVLKGTATESGTFTFTVRAKNPVGADRQQFTITVTAPAVQLSVSSLVRGNTMTVTGSGFKSGDTLELWLHSTPVLLGTATATGGTFTSTVVIPANTAAGQHHLVVVGAKSGTHSVPLTIELPAAVAPAVSPSNLPSRGPQRAATEVAAEEEVTTISDATVIEEVEAPIGEAEAELETLDQPVADGEKPVAPATDWTGLMVGALALLLAAMLGAFVLWRRRKATES